MSEQCPFCHTPIPPGATVCTGCGAERHVGMDTDDIKNFGVGVGIVVFLIAEFVLKTGWLYSLEIAGAVLVISMFAVAIVGRNNVTWKRVQRT